MRILYAGSSITRPTGGGEISAAILLHHLNQNHTLTVLDPGMESAEDSSPLNREPVPPFHNERSLAPYHLRGIRREAHYHEAIRASVRKEEPDLVLLQQPAMLLPGDLPRKTTLVVFLRSFSCYGLVDHRIFRPWKWYGIPFFLLRRKRNLPFLRRADLVFSNSEFMRQAWETRLGIQSSVLYPFVSGNDFGPPAEPDSRKAITFSGMSREKGAHITLQIAAALPDRPFLVLKGRNPERSLLRQFSRLPNVELLDWIQDMKAIYDRTRLVLMPSLWDEPFGRIPVEAGLCQIPSLASDRGGLPESVGECGRLIRQPHRIPDWIAAIRKLDDPACYAEASEEAGRQAQRFEARDSLERFRKAVFEKTGKDLGA